MRAITAAALSLLLAAPRAAFGDATTSDATDPSTSAATPAARDPVDVPVDPPVVTRRPPRSRFANTLSIGGTVGLGSPYGVAGAFLEYRPITWVSAQAGGGFGGSFGPAVGGALYLDPIVTRGWSLGVGGALSHNFSYVSGELVPGRQALPAGTNWASVELETQIRPARGWFMRLGVGRSFLLDTQAFRVASESELNYVGLPVLPLPSPLDAVRAASRDEGFGVWYFHLDIGSAWGL